MKILKFLGIHPSWSIMRLLEKTNFEWAHDKAQSIFWNSETNQYILQAIHCSKILILEISIWVFILLQYEYLKSDWFVSLFWNERVLSTKNAIFCVRGISLFRLNFKKNPSPPNVISRKSSGTIGYYLV